MIVNATRAIRVSEVMNDFQQLQVQLAQMNIQPPAQDYNLAGYQILRYCIDEAQAVLAHPFAAVDAPATTEEGRRQQLAA